jgi:hypothetical protein
MKGGWVEEEEMKRVLSTFCILLMMLSRLYGSKKEEEVKSALT